MGSTKQPVAFTFGAPQQDQPEAEMPAKLSIVDYRPARKGVKLGGGAYNPYERGAEAGDTAKVRKPRVDLRKLSEWIQTTQRVKTLREEELARYPDPASKK